MPITIALVIGKLNLITFLHRKGYTVVGIGNVGCKGLLYYEQGNLVILGKLIKESKSERQRERS
jgi:hypothetical protein